MLDTPVPSFEDLMISIDADEAIDRSTEQKELEAALAELDSDIASGR